MTTSKNNVDQPVSAADSTAGEIEDIFSTGGEEAVVFPAPQSSLPVKSAPTLQSSEQENSVSSETEEAYQPPEYSSKGGGRRVLIIIGAVVLGLVLLGGIVWGLFTLFTRTESIDEIPVEELPVIQPTIIDEPPPITGNDTDIGSEYTPTVVFVDTDHDGLSDQEEVEHNTNPKKSDTDEDGLTDREEVRVYNTDPRNGDTDGDGFLDGAEVASFYDPNDSNPNKRLYDISAK